MAALEDATAQGMQLPWGATKERVKFPDSETLEISTSSKPGEYIMQTLFAEFTVLAEKKIDQVIQHQTEKNTEKPLVKSLQRGEDPHFDQLLMSLGDVAENCLPSLLSVLFEWYDLQNPTDELGNITHNHTTKQRGLFKAKDYLCEKRDLAVDFLYCLVLIEVLQKFPYHPGHDKLVNHIINQCFKHFKYKEGLKENSNAANIAMVTDLYAEVLGVLAQSRFANIKKKFSSDIKELRTRGENPQTVNTIIGLIMGMKFFRIKMHPIEEFRECVQFLHELGSYFLDKEVKDKEIKHTLACIFVEILLPVAAVVKHEVNVPILKTLVEKLYTPTLDLSQKKKHSLSVFPMVTCLLCVSQKQFFLDNWPTFLTQCLTRLKDKDSKMARVALESLYRLVWVYMIRIGGDSNTQTISRLQSIVNSLFPKGQKTIIMPKDAPLNIFVKIIQYIGQERLDFAMREIIYDLLSVGKSLKAVFSPERMIIGLRAFLVIADGLQQKEGLPPMPQTMVTFPSGNTLRFKKTFINKYLSEATARSIGVVMYYNNVRKAFDAILRHLDGAVGKPCLLIKSENVNREPDEIITAERRPKIDLFRTCVAAIPRLMPDGMTNRELIELLARLTVHMDDELGKMAFQSLQNMLVDLPAERNNVVEGFINFIQREVTDTFPRPLEGTIRRVIHILGTWKAAAQSDATSKNKHSKTDKDDRSDSTHNSEALAALNQIHSTNRATLHQVEGLALIMLCSCKPFVRKHAVAILKEVRNLFNILEIPKDGFEPCVLDMMDKSCGDVITTVLPHLPNLEKTAALSAAQVDFDWLATRTTIIWGAYDTYNISDMSDSNAQLSTATMVTESRTYDPWMECMGIFMSTKYVMGQCFTAATHAWPILYNRLSALFVHVDPSTVVAESRASSILSRGKKVTNERDMYMNLWKNYTVMGCCIAPPSAASLDHRSSSPDLNASGDSSTVDPSQLQIQIKPVTSGCNAKDLFKILVPQIKCDVTDMRETIVIGLGKVNPAAFRDLVSELVPLIKDAIDKKQDRSRKKKRDSLRLALARIFHYLAENSMFALCQSDVMDQTTDSLTQTFVEYIDGVRQFIESDADKDPVMLQEIRLHFSEFTRHLIRSTPIGNRYKFISNDLRYRLFTLFASWAGRFGYPFGVVDKTQPKPDTLSELELSSLRSMCAVLCCGPVFDPPGLNEESKVYDWLDTLLSAHPPKIYQLAEECATLLLEFNPDTQPLLDWVIDRCYTSTNQVADGCFQALTKVFSHREYSCDHVAMLNVTLLNTGNPRITIHETAVQLLHLLYKRFFLDDMVHTDHDRDDHAPLWYSTSKLSRKQLEDMLLSEPYSRSQLCLSKTLAALHPDLTMPMLSEISLRMQTAVPSVRQMLLQLLLPWLHNMELVDSNIQITQEPSTGTQGSESSVIAPLKGDGWGSPETTEMVLNNLFYITSRFGDDHPKEIEDVWAAMCVCWPGNLAIIVRYVVIVTGMAPHLVLPHAKKVIMYLGRAKPEKLVDEMMNELRTIESLAFNVERTQTPPFYRLLKKQQTMTSDDSDVSEGHVAGSGQPPSEGDMLAHVKKTPDLSRVSAAEVTQRTNSATSLRSETSTSTISSVAASASSARTAHETDEDVSMRFSDTKRNESPTPYPLPMPPFGGYFAPMSELLPEGSLPNPPYQRCNLGIMLLSELIVDCQDMDWSVHLPLMLHLVFLGMDNSRPLIHEHCKKMLLNLLLVTSVHNDHFSVSKIILCNKAIHEVTSLTLPFVGSNRDSVFMDGSYEAPTINITTPDDHRSSICSLADVDVYDTTELVAKALIEFIITRKKEPLWPFEDITSKVHKISSAEQLERLLTYVLRIFKESNPTAHIEQRWAQEALHLALNCSSRHYAGRSFQVFRCLKVSLSTSDLSEILSRLEQTVSEQGEDMQGYVTEIMLTLEGAVDNLDLEIRPFVRDIFMSTPNLNKELKVEMRKSATITPIRQPQNFHNRSTSYNLSHFARKATVVSPPPPQSMQVESKATTRHHRSSAGEADRKQETNLKRSTSAQSLKMLQDPSAHDDKITILSQMFWIAVSLLESDYEHEFSLAVRLLNKILGHIQPDNPECREKLEKVLKQISWERFPGVQALLLKGCTSTLNAEVTYHLLSKLTLSINSLVISPFPHTEQGPCSHGFAMNVISLLPYLVEHYEDPNTACKDAANRIAQMCQEESNELDNLATVMNLYSGGTFGKDSLQWTKCVVKYLYDVYASISETIIAFLIEVLDKGPYNYQPAVLQILQCIIHYVDIGQLTSNAVNYDLLRVIAKHVESSHWKESMKILKLCVARSSSLSAVPSSFSTAAGDLINLVGSPFTEQEHIRNELPGRTMDFTFKTDRIPVIGQKSLSLKGDMSDGSSRLQDEENISNWKKPHLSQKRTRDRLRKLLDYYDPTPSRKLPPSSSVTFTQDGESPSSTLQRVDSTNRSSEEESAQEGPIDHRSDTIGDDSSTNEALRCFRFLEEEDEERTSISFFGLNTHGNFLEEKKDERMDSSDDETESESPQTESQGLLGIGQITADMGVIEGAEQRYRHPSGSTIHSLAQTDTEDDTTAELSPCNMSPMCDSPFLPMLHSATLVEDQWRAHMKLVMRDVTGSHASQTFYLFTRLFQDAKQQMATLTGEACTFLQKPDYFEIISSQLTNILELLQTRVECPFVYADLCALSAYKFVEQHKICYAELEQCYDTYVRKRSEAIERLSHIRTTMQHTSLVDSPTDYSNRQCQFRVGTPPKYHSLLRKSKGITDLKISLCQHLYGLHFQLLQLFEVYIKLVRKLSDKPGPILDLTAEVCELKEQLVKAELVEGEIADSSPFQIDCKSITQIEGENMMVACLRNKEFAKALKCVRSLRVLFPEDSYAVQLLDDVDTLLYVYCKQQAEAKPGLMVLTESDYDISDMQQCLLEIHSLVAQQQAEQGRVGEGYTMVQELTLGPPDSSTL